jgi:23S rRNA (adenine2503-C2)-methyltransferase
MGCSFCASTKGGLVRSLSSGEIIGQVLTVQRDAGERITNVVVMGSGEPMDNFENVVAFIRLLGCLKPFRFRCTRRTMKPGWA